MRLAITGSRAARASPTVSGAPSHTADGTTATSIPAQHVGQVGVGVGAGQLDAARRIDVREPARSASLISPCSTNRTSPVTAAAAPANWKTPLCQTPAPTKPITSGCERSRGPRSRPTACQIAAADGAPSGSTDTIACRQAAVDQHVATKPGHRLHLADAAGDALDHLEPARRVAAGVAGCGARRAVRAVGARTVAQHAALAHRGGCGRRSATGCAA